MLTIDLSRQTQDRLSAKAKDAGLDIKSYVKQVVEARAAKPTLKELSGDVYQQFISSGMTDEQLGELLEKAKHEMRSDRRARGANAS